MKRILTFFLTSFLVLGLASTQAIAQGLTYVAGTGFTEGEIQGSGSAPADGNIPASSFNYWQEIEGEGGFQQAWGDEARSGDNYANLMTLSNGMWLPGQTSSGGMTMGQTGGSGSIQGGSKQEGPFMITNAEAGTQADTEVTFAVTHPPAPAGEALVYYGTFSISADGSGLDTHANVTGPGVTASVDGMGVVAMWTDISKVPATQTVYVPNGTGITGAFAVEVVNGDEFEITSTAHTAISPGQHLMGSVSVSTASIGGVVASIPIVDLPGRGPGGGGPGGPPGGGF